MCVIFSAMVLTPSFVSFWTDRDFLRGHKRTMTQNYLHPRLPLTDRLRIIHESSHRSGIRMKSYVVVPCRQHLIFGELRIDVCSFSRANKTCFDLLPPFNHYARWLEWRKCLNRGAVFLFCRYRYRHARQRRSHQRWAIDRSPCT